MHSLNFLSRWRPALLIAAGLVAVACNTDDQLSPPLPPGADAPGNELLSVGLEASDLNAAAGSKVAVSLTADSRTKSPLITLQGVVRFDPSRLKYVGQDVRPAAMAMVNEREAARGELRVLALKVPKLDRDVATLVFEVKGAGYASGLRFALEEASTAEGEAL